MSPGLPIIAPLAVEDPRRLSVILAGEPFTPWFGAGALGDAFVEVVVVAADGRVRVDSPGLLTVAGRFLVVLPRAYTGATLEPRAAQRATLALVRTLRAYLADGRRSAVARTNAPLAPAVVTCGDVTNTLDRIEAALQLLADRDEYGPLFVQERRTSPRERGRIHWPRTLARSAIVLSGKNVVIPDPVLTRFRIEPSHPLTALHELVCQHAAALLGAGHMPVLDALAGRAVLDRTERTLYQDRQRRVCGLLRKYLEVATATPTSERTRTAGVFATDFPRVWERMVAVALGPMVDVRPPGGRYQLAGPQGGSAPGLHLIPDLVIDALVNGERRRLVIDAKEYAPALTGYWPKTESITKQLLYRYFLSAAYAPEHPPFERVANAFLLPGRVAGGGGVAVMAVHEIAGEEQTPTAFGRVACLALDFETVAAAYVRGRADGELRGRVVETVMTRMASAP